MIRELGLICLEKKRKIRFGFKNPILDFLREAHPQLNSKDGDIRPQQLISIDGYASLLGNSEMLFSRDSEKNEQKYLKCVILVLNKENNDF